MNEVSNKLLIKKITVAASSASKSAGAAFSALWTFPAIVFAAMIIAWAAEAAQFFISQGMALAVLAWLQTLPEFAVEAVIAWEAGKDPEKIHLVTANFTGSLRLLVGLAWPMIYATAAFFYRRKNGGSSGPLREIALEDEHSVEITGLLLPIIYFFIIYFKGTLTFIDSFVLSFFYFLYLFFLNKIPPKDAEEAEDLDYVPRKILEFKPFLRNISIAGLFLLGGGIIYFVAEPFFHSMLSLAITLGVSQFIFVQWVAPFLSEFPEKVSAFYWAKKITKAPMALMNMVSSNINQWTVLVAMIPFVYSLSRGEISSLVFDNHQRSEILLTIAQSLLGFVLLSNMKFSWYEAAGLFCLWLIQFVVPSIREEITWIYFSWIGLELLLVLLRRRRLQSFNLFFLLCKRHF